MVELRIAKSKDEEEERKKHQTNVLIVPKVSYCFVYIEDVWKGKEIIFVLFYEDFGSL